MYRKNGGKKLPHWGKWIAILVLAFIVFLVGVYRCIILTGNYLTSDTEFNVAARKMMPELS